MSFYLADNCESYATVHNGTLKKLNHIVEEVFVTSGLSLCAVAYKSKKSTKQEPSYPPLQHVLLPCRYIQYALSGQDGNVACCIPCSRVFQLGAEGERLNIFMHGKGRVYQSEWFTAAVCSTAASMFSKPAPKPIVNRQQACKRVHLRNFWHQNDTSN